MCFKLEFKIVCICCGTRYDFVVQYCIPAREQGYYHSAAKGHLALRRDRSALGCVIHFRTRMYAALRVASFLNSVCFVLLLVTVHFV